MVEVSRAAERTQTAIAEKSYLWKLPGVSTWHLYKSSRPEAGGWTSSWGLLRKLRRSRDGRSAGLECTIFWFSSFCWTCSHGNQQHYTCNHQVVNSRWLSVIAKYHLFPFHHCYHMAAATLCQILSVYAKLLLGRVCNGDSQLKYWGADKTSFSANI